MEVEMEYFSYEELVRGTDGFSARKLLGKGSQGSVYVAHLPNRDGPVAVKAPYLEGDLRNEITVMSSLGINSISHVMRFLGTCHCSELLVSEYLPNGSLHDVLHGKNSPPLLWQDRLRIAAEIASALNFLHEEARVVHRDVKPENILFDYAFSAKLADFGLAVKEEEKGRRAAGTIGYMDPSYTTPESLSTKNDIFSYGVLLLELLSGRKAVDVSRHPSGVVDWALPLITSHRSLQILDLRLSPPPPTEAAALQKLLEFAVMCVSPEVDRRPAMSNVVSALYLCGSLRRDCFWSRFLVRLRRHSFHHYYYCYHSSSCKIQPQ